LEEKDTTSKSAVRELGLVRVSRVSQKLPAAVSAPLATDYATECAPSKIVKRMI
jgi:hypothetical protein